MAITMGGCDGGSLQRVRVEQKPGTSRLMSTNADGLHCSSCSGDLTVTDCTFSGTGDDGINVTGLYLAVVPDEDQRTLTLTGGHYVPAPIFAAPQITDRLLLVNGQTLKSLGEVQVQAVDRKEPGQWTIHVPADHPSLSGAPIFAIDLRARARLLASRCNFPGNLGRGVLAHSDAIIEHCSFTHQSHSAILLAPDMFWQEGPAIERTAVRGNQVRTGNKLASVPGAVWIGAFVAPGGRQGIETTEIVNQNVAVENNVFVQPNGPAVAATSTRDLRIEGNQIERASPVAFHLKDVRDVHLRGNRSDPAATIEVDPSSIKEVSMSGNTGLHVT
jgi:hypothetical protein